MGFVYCDVQCPHDLKFINGEANMEDWIPSEADKNAGTGKYGSCCTEIDIWEANKMATAYTMHSCSPGEQTRCDGADCGDNGEDRFKGLCDKNGCDIQPHRLDFVTEGEYSTNIGPRTFLMKDDYAYHLFQLKNKEFTYTVDDSNLDCGLNGALYFVQMDADGGKSKYGNAGAQMGLGYCDAQCPHDLKFINGEANMEDWIPSEADKNAGTGKYGSCCTEIDIWEANKISTAYTMHACS